jgi:hypothetical protein
MARHTQRERACCKGMSRYSTYLFVCLGALAIAVCKILLTSENVDVESVASGVNAYVTFNTSRVGEDALFVKSSLPNNAWKFKLYEGQNVMYFNRFLELMNFPNSPCRTLFLQQLQSVDMEAFFWECPPISSTSVSSVPFEFVLIPAPGLLKKNINPRAFSSKFADCTEGVTSFQNTGKDAQLVVPCPISNQAQPTHAEYGHLAAFVRGAPPAQVDALLRRVAADAKRRLDTFRGNIWLSTSGLGVQWLHVRMDSTPKYYNWTPYTR